MFLKLDYIYVKVTISSNNNHNKITVFSSAAKQR